MIYSLHLKEDDLFLEGHERIKHEIENEVGDKGVSIFNNE